MVLLQGGQISSSEKISFGIPHLQKVKHLTVANIKKYEHIILVEILRHYVRTTSFLKKKYQEIKIKIISLKRKNHIEGEQKEISKFLKIIGDYKNRIREIKHKITKEEEGL